MKKVLIINAHQYYSFSEGKLTKTLVEKIDNQLANKGYEVKHSNVMDEYKTDDEVDKHVWADAVILQSPVNWMGLPWMAKKYYDEVFTAGGGKLAVSDGRSAAAPKENYGGGGLLKEKKYMLSLTLNAPTEAFNSPGEYLFQGKSVDDLWFPQHMNYRFLGMSAIETFVCYDVMKNPEIENDFTRLSDHLNKYF